MSSPVRSTITLIALIGLCWSLALAAPCLARAQEPLEQPAAAQGEPLAQPDDQVDVQAASVPGAAMLSAGSGLEQDLDVTLSLDDRMQIVFTRRGARIKSLELIEPDPSGKANFRYRKTLAPDSDPWQMVDFAPDEYNHGESYYPLSTGMMYSLDNSQSYYDDAEDDLVYRKAEQAGNSVTFVAQTADGLVITKRFTISPEVYSIELELTIENNSEVKIEGRPYINLYSIYRPSKRSFMGPPPKQVNLVSYNGSERESDALSPKKQIGELVPGTLWVAFVSNYWMTGLAHTSDTATQYQSGFLNEEVVIARTLVNTQTIEPGQSRRLIFTCYSGPMIKELLVEAGSDFNKALYFGWFTPIALGMLWILKLFYGAFGNWGVAIILVTVIIRLGMFPLTHKSQQSMRHMGKLQPLIKQLREKYKDDKEALNREMMALYKTHKINPAGGCLPLLIQFPIFIAFYRMLYMAIELRHAPFLWWITDLSAPDVAFQMPGLGWGVPILPFFMGASMYATQKLTPTNPDPTQQKIMQLMPLFFMFIFISFPSGLVLYWLVSNILGIGQQLLTNKLIKDEPLELPPSQQQQNAGHKSKSEN
ncbi:MAG: membrane protein insertase YidC [Candidatus Alcyoniella australis]|nr:membrane protein insertase YidC [Candidatus Alcyoniella australis]